MEQQMALLIQAFNLTILSNNTQDIKKGEQLLEQYQVQEGYIQALMLLVNRKQEPLLVRQAAVVNLTSLIDNSWRHTLLSKAKLSDNDRNAIKNNILEALIQSVDEAKISINYEKIINKIANYDYPQQWPHITENILLNIQESKTFQHLHGSILAVKNIVQVYQFYVGEDRDNLNKIIVPRLIPLLLETIQKIIPIANDQTINTIEQILKIYYSISHLDLPVDMQGDQSLDGWMTIFKTFIDKPIPQPLTIKTIDQDEIHSRQKNINWKIQKQCCRIVQRFIQKYANPKSDYKQVSARFQDLYILHFLESFILILNNSVKNYVAPKVTIAALKCVFYCIQQKQIFEKLNPHLENILYEICIPLTYLTPHDEDQWKNDPQEYVRREEDFMPTVKTCSMDLIEQICEKSDASGQSYLMKFMFFMAAQLSDPSLNILKKEALLKIFAILKSSIMENKSLVDQIEQLLEKIIIPDLKSSNGFLRARACMVLGKYGHIDFKNAINIQNSIEGLLLCFQDKHLPVQVSAAIALNTLINHRDAQNLLKPYLANMIETYLKLMDSIDHEGIVSALEGLVQVFQNDVVPFAYELTIHLCNAFKKFVAKCNQAGQDENIEWNGESEMTAAGCLDAIRKILMAPLSEQLYFQISEVLLPTFNYVFSQDGIEFIDEGLGLFNQLLYKSKVINPKLWLYYPLFCYMIVGLPNSAPSENFKQLDPQYLECIEGNRDGYGAEYLESLLPCFKNFIQKGQKAFLNEKDLFGTTFIDLLFQVMKKVYQIGLNGEDDYEMILVTTLFIVLLENNLGNIDHLLDMILETVVQNLKIKKSKSFKIVNFEVIAIALWYNPKLVIDCFESKKYTLHVFSTWFQSLNLFKQDYEKIRVLIGLSSLLKLSESQIPQEIIQSLTPLMKEMVKMTTDILELREQDDSLDNLDNDSDDEDNKQIFDKVKVVKDDTEMEDQQNFGDELDDDDDIDEERNCAYYESPLEKIDEIIYFKDILEGLAAANSPLYNKLVIGLLDSEKQTLLKNFALAQEQYAEYLKNLQEEQQLQQ